MRVSSRSLKEGGRAGAVTLEEMRGREAQKGEAKDGRRESEAEPTELPWTHDGTRARL